MKEDLHYLKDFLKRHPDNKMGWYLLGCQYELAGKKAKALYCYKKAGEVFVAFEEKTLPPEPGERAEDRDREADLADGLSRSRPPLRRSSALLRSLRVAIMLALVLAGVAYSPGLQESRPPAEPEAAGVTVQPEKGAYSVYYARGIEGPEELRKALGDMIFSAGSPVRYSVLAQPPVSKDGRWALWAAAPRILLSAEWKAGLGKADVSYHQRETCGCQPADPSRAAAAVIEWKAMQEQMAVLRSAIAAFKQDKGKLPSTLDELAGDYPNNRLAGYTSLMEEAWKELASVPATDKTGGAPYGDNGKTGAPRAPASGVVSESPLSEPFEIIVDKAAHRLALVSGKVIVRNYPVGLGGVKTPEGPFRITEKVRNPNGTSRGPFGSRGMTLSDTLYAIHGTDEPWSIGKDLSHGCVRMLQDDLEELYYFASTGTKVTIKSGVLPAEVQRSKHRFRLPLMLEETNPKKTYKWLN